MSESKDNVDVMFNALMTFKTEEHNEFKKERYDGNTILINPKGYSCYIKIELVKGYDINWRIVHYDFCVDYKCGIEALTKVGEILKGLKNQKGVEKL